MSEKTPRNLILGYFLVLFLISIFLMGWLFQPFVSTLILSAVVTSLFTPIYQFFNKNNRLTPSIASLTTCLLIFITLFVPVVFIVGILSTEAYDLYVMAKGAGLSDQLKLLIQNNRILDRSAQVLAQYHIQFSAEDLNNAITELIKIVGLFLYKQAGSIASNFLNFFVNFFFMLLVTYFLLMDGKHFLTFIVKLSPLPKEQDEQLIRKFKDMAGAILIGNGICGVVQGTLGGMVFSFFGLNSPILWGVIMGLLAFLPILGIGLVFIPAAAFLFLKGHIGAGVFFIVFYIVLSSAVEYIVKPKLVGNRVKMHTLIVFLSIIGGLKLFGLIGIIYGPLIATGFLTLTEIYNANYLRMVNPNSMQRSSQTDGME